MVGPVRNSLTTAQYTARIVTSSIRVQGERASRSFEGFQPLIATTLSVNASTGSKSIFVNDASSFDTATMKYISINGSEAHCITAIDAGTKELQFHGWDKLTNDHLAGEPVYLVQAITYSIGPFEGKSCLLRDDHLGVEGHNPWPKT